MCRRGWRCGWIRWWRCVTSEVRSSAFGLGRKEEEDSMKLLAWLRCVLSAVFDRARIEKDTEEELRAHVLNRAEDFERRSEEHTSELQSLRQLVCRLLL